MNVPDGSRPGARAARGFSIVDLLVSLAVMALLIAFLLPSLSRVQEAAHRTKSASNIRQQGIGVTMFSFDRDGLLPTSVFLDRGRMGTDAPEQMVYLRVSAATAQSTTGRAAVKAGPDADPNKVFVWDGLGKLIPAEYIKHGEVFYNPSHDYVHTYDRYADRFADQDGEIVCNYHWRWDPAARRIDRIRPLTTMIADAMRSQREYNHVVGNNMLKGDMSVTWFQDTTGELYDSLAPETPSEVATASLVQVSREGVLRGWSLLDNTSVKTGTAHDPNTVNSPVGAFFGLVK